ncbi:hypothetical protein D3C72_1076000 [compost metagenome]
MEQHGADGHPDRAPQLAAEVEQGHADAAIFPRQGVLHHHRERRQHQSEPQTGEAQPQIGKEIEVNLPQGQRRQGEARHHEALVVTGATYELAADEGPRRDADHEDHHVEAALAGPHPLLPLHLQRQVDQHGEHQQLRGQRQQHAHQITGQAGQMGGQYGILGPSLHQDEQQQGQRQPRRQPDGGQRRLRREQQQGEGGDGDEQPRPLPVEAAVAAHIEVAQVAVHQPERERPEGQVDPEDPAPAQLLGEVAPEQGPGDAGDRIDRRDVALILAHLPRGNAVGDDGEGQRDQPPAPQSLQHAGRQQGRQILGKGAGHGSRQKQAYADVEHPHPAEQIAQLTVDGQGRGGRQQVGGDHPGEGGAGVQLGPYDGQGGGDYALFQ